MDAAKNREKTTFCFRTFSGLILAGCWWKLASVVTAHGLNRMCKLVINGYKWKRKYAKLKKKENAYVTGVL